MESNKLAEIKNANKDLKILTWNIYMLPHCNLFHGNCARARIIAEKLYETDYDIIVLEEAFDYRARSIIRNKLKDKYPFMYGPANNSFFSLRTSSGVWILSAVPLNKIKEIEYKSKFGIDAFARKGAVMFEGNWNGSEFQLIGTHLQADSPDSIRRKQCREIAVSLLQQNAKPNVMQIICGDFNIDKDDTANYNYMLNVLGVENGMLEGDLNTSFDEINNTLAKRENGKKHLIDYVLIHNSQFISFIQRKVSVFRKYIGNKFIELSDHYAIEARVRFTSAIKYSASLN